MNRPESDGIELAHARCFELLPWYQNGSLAGSELSAVRQHLGQCLVCAREVRRLRQLETAIVAPVGEHACAQAFARLAQQIKPAEVKRGWGARALLALRGVFEPVPLFAGAALLVLSSVLAAFIVSSGKVAPAQPDQPFQTLGTQRNLSSEVSHPLLRVVLDDDLPSAARLSWFARHDAEIVEGPSEIGVMTVRVATGTRAFNQVIEQIRSDRDTLFVEPVSFIGKRPDRQR